MLVDRFHRLDLAKRAAGAAVVALLGRTDAIEPRRARAEMNGSRRRRHLADRDQLIAERLERLHHLPELEVRANGLGMEEIGPYAVREVHRAEPEWRVSSCTRLG